MLIIGANVSVTQYALFTRHSCCQQDSDNLFLPYSSIMVRFLGDYSNGIECHFFQSDSDSIRGGRGSSDAPKPPGAQMRSVLSRHLKAPILFCVNSMTDGVQRLLRSRDPTRRGQQEQAAHLIRCSNSTLTILPVFGCMFQAVYHLLCADVYNQRPVHRSGSVSLFHWLDLLSSYLCQNCSRFYKIICMGRCPEYLSLLLNHVWLWGR